MATLTTESINTEINWGDRGGSNRVQGDIDTLDLFAAEIKKVEETIPRRINADPEHLENGLAKLVLTVIDLLRRLMEKQAMRRMEGGSLTDEDIESVEQLLAERTDCKRDRDFAAADRIRDRLMSEYQIRVDDRTMEWHVVTNEYTHTPSNHNLDDDALSYIREQVNQRAVAKLEKDYELADDIRDALMDQFAVNIDDRMKGTFT